MTMIPLRFDTKDRGLRILCLGAHCDDIEIGCGGTLLKLIREYPIDHVKWVVFTSNETREAEAHNSAQFFLMDVKNKEVIIRDYEDTILYMRAGEVKAHFEKLKRSYRPDVIFTHYRNDLHQDHRLLNQLTWNTFRSELILEYEITKYDGDMGNPTFFVPLDSEIASSKVHALLDNYPSQKSKHWFDEETFYSLMRLRGVECASRYAEAFYMRKGVL